jgi:endonuclease/exonuclease/phosphatase family metal-dependent hydrolase
VIVRVLSWNVHGLRGGVGASVELVERLRPDVLLLQETGARGKLAAFVSTLDLRVSADPTVPFRRRVRNAVAVRKPWTIEATHHARFAGGSWLYPRGAAVADLGLGPARLRVISTHLGLRPEERSRHARDLLVEVDRFNGPSVVGGDLNAHPHQPAAMALAERMHDVWEPSIGAGHTYPADAPAARIDYVFVTGQITVRDADVVPTDVSDHLPVVAELELLAG